MLNLIVAAIEMLSSCDFDVVKRKAQLLKGMSGCESAAVLTVP